VLFTTYSANWRIFRRPRQRKKRNRREKRNIVHADSDEKIKNYFNDDSCINLN
jgi:hypothetical protein